MDDVTVHLVDGTFELFRCFHGAPRARNAAGREVGAARGVLATLAALLREPGATHVVVAFDSVVAPRGSARAMNDDQLIAAQAPLAAEAARALGLPVWPSGRYQADELIATAAARFSAEARVVICSTDNDFNQCVRGDRVVVLDRVRKVVTDEAAVRVRYGIAPQQIPDLFALVGDVSDGLPGVPGWGLKSAAAVLQRYGSVEAIPLEEAEWDIPMRGAARLAATLRDRREEALICRDLAVLRTDLPLRQTVDDVRRRAVDRGRLEQLCAVLEDTTVPARLGI